MLRKLLRKSKEPPTSFETGRANSLQVVSDPFSPLERHVLSDVETTLATLRCPPASTPDNNFFVIAFSDIIPPRFKLMMSNSAEEITRMLQAWSRGDESALKSLTPLVYEELRRLAHRYMGRQRHGQILQTTALVNEAYLRLVDVSQVSWQNRPTFSPSRRS